MTKTNSDPGVNESHLRSDEILVAVVDHKDLPQERQDHLKACPVCSSEMENNQRRLRKLGVLARQSTPLPGARVRLPDEDEVDHRHGGIQRWFRLKPAGVMLAAAVLALLVAILGPYGRNMKVAPRPQSARNMAAQSISDDSASLMERMQELIENPLPEGYREIAAVIDLTPVGYDMDFLVPEIEGNGHPEPNQKEESA
jgi:hypothetical protein